MLRLLNLQGRSGAEEDLWGGRAWIHFHFITLFAFALFHSSVKCKEKDISTGKKLPSINSLMMGPLYSSSVVFGCETLD